MAARGDREAVRVLQVLNDPEAKRLDAEIDAAIEAHPDWRFYDEPGHFGYVGKDPDEDSIEKLLAWYRRRNAA